MIRKALIERIYDAASIQRWNDHVRPVEFTELDKQAHKIIIAYVIAKFEEGDRKAAIDWNIIIEGELFEFLQRVILTDIKPPVFHKMMQKSGAKLNQWILDKIGPELAEINGNLIDNFKRYIFDPSFGIKEKRILKAAHYLASNWEFKIIYHTCPFIYGIENTKEEIENQIEDHYDIIGVQKISLQKKSFGFIDLCGQLRFQKRWAQSPRIPQTSVLGHMLVVAFLSYLCSKELKACNKRMYNNFFGALFHDLPEVLTRDIVSPVKSSIKGLEKIITEYENIHIEERILPLLPLAWHDEMKYFLQDPFTNKIVVGGVKSGVSTTDINKKYNTDEHRAIDGELINVCDQLAAFIEASLSKSHGITSKHLTQAIDSIYKNNASKKIGSLSLGSLFDYFK